MSNIISKIRTRIALKEKNKFDLSCDHITTSDFFHINPVYIKEMVPGENIKINVQTFTRLTPLVRPMYGRCQIINRAFFVPMRTIMKGWNEFITDTVKDGVFPVVPKINLTTLSVCLREDFASTTGATSSNYDFSVQVTSGQTTQTTYYKFTAQGRRVWSLLQALGYRFPIGYYSSSDVQVTDDEYPSALPLIAFAKIYYDWYKNQAYAADEWFNGLFDLSTSAAPVIDRTTLGALLTVCSRAVYDKDYFTSAWDRPVASNNGMSSNNTIYDITNDNTTGLNSRSAAVRNLATPSSASPTTPVISGVSNGSVSGTTAPANISQYAIKALYRLTDYLKRHQIAGGLAMDRYLSRFGVKPSDAALMRSIYLGKDAVDINIADVTSTANTDDGDNGSSLGQYAGKGVGYSGNGWFKYDTDEYGYLMVVSTIVPKVGYVQGMNRQVMHRGRLDFFTPEFDSLGVQAIARKELLSDYNNAESTLLTLGAQALEGVFGYTSRYAEYKTAKDNLTGQFTVPSINRGMSTWHLNRLFDATQILELRDLSHDQSFVIAADAAQYDRVFAITDENSPGYDHFINIYHFNIEDYSPMSKLFDDYEYEHDAGNKEVSIEVNGTQLN